MPARSVLYLFGQLLLSLRSRAGGLAALGVLLTIVWTLFLAIALLLAGGQVEDISVQLLAALTRPIAQADLAALYEQSRAWPEVKQVRYVFPEQAVHSEAQLPTAARRYGYLELQLRFPGDRDAVSARLNAQAPWLSILPPQRGLVRRLWQDEPALRPAIFGVLAGLLLALLALFYYGAFRLLAQGWAAELELLKLAGLSWRTLALPFMLVGLLCGGLAAAGAVALTSLSPLLIRRVTLLSTWLPELRGARLAVEISLAAFLIDLALSGLMGLLAFVAAWRILKRLRIAGRSAPAAPKLKEAKSQEANEPQRHEEEFQRLER